MANLTKSKTSITQTPSALSCSARRHEATERYEFALAEQGYYKALPVVTMLV